ncbi:MAG: hypothetical protein KF900_09450 [Bacteroidetes bacterium]|nr:hypothetical protein [Bacteroidota bacterium]
MEKKVTVMKEAFVLKPYTKKEICQILGIPKHIRQKWLKAIEPSIGKPMGNLYSTKQVKFIIDTYGISGKIVNETN